MATLILTTVGAAIGGPVGAVIGSAIGGVVDRTVLFPPGGREGPRLTELAVQTSSYGTQIPKLFGAMRVAGTVIWSTDLIESRATSRSGKGQPSVTSYSYSASFAVLLSARPIRDVGRIWAEGKLLRGAAGDFKVQTGFRVHRGDEDQAPDPLIASLYGDRAPACRGGAYVVFEGLQLADYGNRIPSLTFEVIADDAPVSVGSVAATLVPMLSGETPLPFGGFAASGESMAGVLATLARISGSTIAEARDGLVMRDRPADIGVVTDDGYAARDQGPIGQRSRAAAASVPQTVSVSYYDPARDYQAGLQRAARSGAGIAEMRLEVPAAIDAGAAKTIAAAALMRAEAGRETRTLALGFAGLALAPGDGVTIMGEAGSWQVRETSVEAMVATIVLDEVTGPTVPREADSGTVVASSDVEIGATRLCVAELPPLDDSVLSAPQLAVFATGTGGWRGAVLLVSLDDGASWQPAGATAAPAVIGTVDRPPAAGPATILDCAATLTVALVRPDDLLHDADDAQLDQGVNLALVGDELLQFGRAEPLGGGRWQLSRLMRGRRGTEGMIGRQSAGDRFILVERDTFLALPLPVGVIGASVRVMASGIGDGAGPVERRIVITGVSVAPPSPVALTIDRQAGGDALLRWTRRSRFGWRWIDGVDAPLGEEVERYRLTLGMAAGDERLIELNAPGVRLSADDLAGVATVTVRQLGTLAASQPATISI